MNRRQLLRTLAALGAGATLPAFATDSGGKPRARVVVVGGGYGGTTAAKYLRMWSGGTVDVTLVERQPALISCPLSNLVLGGYRTLDDLTVSYDSLASRWGVRVVRGEVTAIDPAARQVRLADGSVLPFDRVIVAPGVDLLPERIEGYAGHEERLPHAWKAGPQTTLLRDQIAAMPDNGVFAMFVPQAPYRCPPGPYERACVVAHWLQQHKPRAKVLVYDANPEVVSKKALFMQAFSERYAGILEYVPNSTLLAVDAQARSAHLEFDDVRADVLNVIPPQRAGRLVDSFGPQLVNNQWVEVDFLTMEARGVPGVHVIGDAIRAADAMPKSGHMANQHAKHVAAAVLALLDGREPNADALVMNTCYSFVNDREVIHVASVHRYEADKATFVPVEGAGGVSAQASELEGHYANAWAQTIWADMTA